MLRQPPRSTRPDTRFPSTALFRSLGPRDGKDSIQLPLALEPAGPYADGDTVTVTGSGFVPGERVGIVQCAREAGGEIREARGAVGRSDERSAGQERVSTCRYRRSAWHAHRQLINQ